MMGITAQVGMVGVCVAKDQIDRPITTTNVSGAPGPLPCISLP
jgi:hypothetical protein